MKKVELSAQALSEFCRELAVLLHAGVYVSDALSLLSQEENAPNKKLLTDMLEKVDEGAALSAAMESCNAFPGFVTGMVRVGEQSGRLEEALDALAKHYEARQRTARQMRNALAYPALLMLLMLVVIAVLLVKVLPVFDTVYASLGGQLTGLAAGLLYLGGVLQAILPILLGVLGIAAIGVLLFSCCTAVRERVVMLWRRMMGDRGMMKKQNNAQFAQALAMGLRSGLSLEEAADLAALLLADVPDAAARCAQCAARLADGAALAEALESTGFLSASACRLLSVGLRGGNGDVVMDQIAQQLTDEAAQTLEDRMAKIEPAMVLGASIAVGVILLSVMLPLMNILSAIG